MKKHLPNFVLFLAIILGALSFGLMFTNILEYTQTSQALGQTITVHEAYPFADILFGTKDTYEVLGQTVTRVTYGATLSFVGYAIALVGAGVTAFTLFGLKKTNIKNLIYVVLTAGFIAAGIFILLTPSTYCNANPNIDPSFHQYYHLSATSIISGVASILAGLCTFTPVVLRLLKK